MATREELREAIDDYIARSAKSERVLRSLRNWNCVIYFEATDIAAGFTMTIKDGKATVSDGTQGAADLIVRGSSEDLADIFGGDANPASNYVQGSSAHTLSTITWQQGMRSLLWTIYGSMEAAARPISIPKRTSTRQTLQI